jgi:hypothetical protein
MLKIQRINIYKHDLKKYQQILLNRLTKYATIHNKLTQTQFGFRKGKSISDRIFILKSIIAKNHQMKKKNYTAYSSTACSFLTKSKRNTSCGKNV